MEQQRVVPAQQCFRSPAAILPEGPRLESKRFHEHLSQSEPLLAAAHALVRRLNTLNVQEAAASQQPLPQLERMLLQHFP